MLLEMKELLDFRTHFIFVLSFMEQYHSSYHDCYQIHSSGILFAHVNKFILYVCMCITLFK